MEQQEIKTDLDIAALPKFVFKTDLPMQSLVITTDDPSVLESKGKIFEVSKDDSRANDGRKRVRLIASSDATDLVGDVMSKNALNQMKNAAIGTTIFLNHSTSVPEDVFGAVETAELKNQTFTITDGGQVKTITFMCLIYDILVEETSDRAVKVFNMIDAGTTKLGASITIGIVNQSKYKDGRRSIDEVIYLETSIVGIPCNQTCWVEYVKSKSWVQQASKALKGMSMDGVKVGSVSEPFNVDSLYIKPVSVTIASDLLLLKSSIPQVTTLTNSERTMSLILSAKSAKEAVTAFKDMFTEAVQDHYENPWLYMYILEDCMMELIYWNTGMPTDEKLAAAADMIDAFKAKELEILGLYFADDEDEKSVSFKAAFNAAATKHLQFMMKEGRRNNTSDAQTIQKIHDMSCSLGAGCTEHEEKTAVTDKAKIAATPIPLGEAAPAVEESPTLIEQADLSVEAAAAIEKSTALIEELQAKVTQLETDNASLKETNEKLFIANKAFAKQYMKWKAGALTAGQMLVNHLEQPAPRPGASVN